MNQSVRIALWAALLLWIAMPGAMLLAQEATPAKNRVHEELADSSELYSGKEFSKAFANPNDDPNLPNVLLIGDSISISYTVEVRKLMKGKADIFRIPSNGKNAAFGLKKLDKWLGKKTKWDVIHFNWGLWDLCYSCLLYTSPSPRDRG